MEELVGRFSETGFKMLDFTMSRSHTSEYLRIEHTYLYNYRTLDKNTYRRRRLLNPCSPV